MLPYLIPAGFMTQNLSKIMFSFLMPSGLIFFVALGFLRPQGLPAWLQPPVAALPYCVLTFAMLFGWYFSSVRTMLSLLILTFADRALVLFPVTGSEPLALHRTIFSLATFFLPLNLLAFSLMKEDTVSTIRGWLLMVLVWTQPVLLLWLCQAEQQEITATFQASNFLWSPTTWTQVPQLALLTFAVATAMFLVRFILYRDPMDGGAFWVLAAVFMAYHGIQFAWHPTNFFSAGGLILLVTLIQSSYQRTYRDELTGIPGRLAYEEAKAQLGKRYAIAILSLDQLKSYANIHGKSVTEQILKLIAPKAMAACNGGRVFRVSGEELTLLFPNHTATETLIPLDNVRKTLENTSVVLRGRDRVWENPNGIGRIGKKDQELPLTASIGVADNTSEDIDVGLVIKTAYRALYDAKSTGGNAVKRGIASAGPMRRSPIGSGRIIPSNDY